MVNKFDINSKDYWDVRFENDWESNSGREQTKFFANIAVENIPNWLLSDINNNRLNICDVGCAEGDAVPVLGNKFFKSEIIGLDFSEQAIIKAKKYYPSYRFECGAIENLEETFDVLFSSNVLEHFSRPFDIIENMLLKTRKHLILLLPFQEYHRVKEHFFTFDYEHFPINLDDFSLTFYKEIDGSKYPHKLWPLKQILLVYTNSQYLKDLGITLESFSGTVVDLEKEINILQDEIENLQNQNNLIQKEKETIQKDNEAVRSENENYKNQISKLNNEYEVLLENIKNLELDIKRISKDSDDYIDELKNSNTFYIQALNKRENELNAIYNSKFYRKIMSPYYKFRGKRNLFNRTLNFLRRNNKKELISVAYNKAKNEKTKHLHNTKHKEMLKEILNKHSGKEIIVFPPLVDWNIPLYQRPQHIALNLAEQGYLYFFCTGNMKYESIDGFKQIADSCYVTNRFDLLNSELDSKILHLYSTDMNPHKELLDNTIKNGNKILYEYIDEIHEDLSGPIPLEVIEKHERLLKDEENCIVIASADKLYNEVLKNRSRNTALVTNGVEYEHFHITKDKYDTPEEILSVVKKGKPIIGYFGAFASWFDYEVVIKLATERPEYEILLIGWDYDKSIEKYNLDKYPNITVIGPINYKELPKYAIHFSVSTIPFVLNDITESTSPIKLFEYMALGHPIVTTDMPECRKYESVLIGKTHNDFIDKVDKAISLKEDKLYNSILEKEALENTWEAKSLAIKSML